VKPVRFHPEAEAEYLGALHHYAGITESLGRSVYRHMAELLAEVERQPQSFRMFDPPARRHFGSRFPYSIIYLDHPDKVWVVAVAHFKQRPGYWKERVK
jgi:hypothetical protein